MPWLELTCTVPRTAAEKVSTHLEELGALAVTMKDAADQPVLEPKPGEVRLWEATAVTGLFEADADAKSLIARLQQHFPGDIPVLFSAVPLADDDWVQRSLDQFTPLRFGQRLWVVPQWHSPPDPTAINVILNPGLAFGTGTHPTTAMCLEWLDGNSVADAVVVDFGCGSGVLAIAAARLGARHVFAVDHDPQAIEATLANATLNDVTHRIRFVASEALPAGNCDVILANILAGPLMELAPHFSQLLHPGGRLILSGVLVNQAQSVAASYQPWFTISVAQEQDEWVRLDAVRIPTPASTTRPGNHGARS